VKFAPCRRTGIRAIGIYTAVAGVRPALFAVEKLFPGKRSRFLELIGSIVVADPPTTRDIYELTVHHLGEA